MSRRATGTTVPAARRSSSALSGMRTCRPTRTNVMRRSAGAMSGRGEKGLLITTATFSPAAREEATRDGAPPVDLISGEDLCDLLKDHELGVKTTTRLIEDIEVVREFFDEI
jgi:restriction system protein